MEKMERRGNRSLEGRAEWRTKDAFGGGVGEFVVLKMVTLYFSRNLQYFESKSDVLTPTVPNFLLDRYFDGIIIFTLDKMW